MSMPDTDNAYSIGHAVMDAAVSDREMSERPLALPRTQQQLPTAASTGEGITITFEDLGVVVQNRTRRKRRVQALGHTWTLPSWTAAASGTTPRVVLEDVTGFVAAGQSAAIMGPSGAGKSTLLDILAQRKPRGGYSGDVLYDGRVPTRSMVRTETAYVLQQDAMLGDMTVYEHLFFVAMVTLQGQTREQKKARVREILEQMDLERCQHTMVGNRYFRGVSGGEKKRVYIGSCMVQRPTCLFLDEPTSGLDSATALSILRTIQSTSMSSTGRNRCTQVMIIHQPSPEIYNLFDMLILLNEGKLCYFGVGKVAPIDYFTEQGFPYRSGYNVAEFLLSCIVKGCKQWSSYCMESSPVSGTSERIVMGNRQHGVSTSIDERSPANDEYDESSDDAVETEDNVTPAMNKHDFARSYSGSTLRTRNVSLARKLSLDYKNKKPTSNSPLPTIATPRGAAACDSSATADALESSSDYALPEVEKDTNTTDLLGLREFYLSVSHSERNEQSADIGMYASEHSHQQVITETTAPATANTPVSDGTVVPKEEQLGIERASGKNNIVSTESSRGYAFSLPEEIWVLFAYRQLPRTLNFLHYFTRVGIGLMLGVILGVFFAHQRYDMAGVYNINGVIFIAVFLPSFCCDWFIDEYKMERKTYSRDIKDAHYRPLSYVLSKFLSIVPSTLLASLAFTAVFYEFVGLTSGAGHFCFFFLVFFNSYMVASTMGGFLGCVFPGEVMPNSLFPIIQTFTILNTGFLIRKSTIHSAWVWLYWISYTQWSFSALMINQYKDQIFYDWCSEDAEYPPIIGIPDNVRNLLVNMLRGGGSQCPPIYGNEILETYELSGRDQWTNLLYASLTVPFFVFGQYLGVKYIDHDNDSS